MTGEALINKSISLTRLKIENPSADTLVVNTSLIGTDEIT